MGRFDLTGGSDIVRSQSGPGSLSKWLSWWVRCDSGHERQPLQAQGIPGIVNLNLQLVMQKVKEFA